MSVEFKTSDTWDHLSQLTKFIIPTTLRDNVKMKSSECICTTFVQIPSINSAKVRIKSINRTNKFHPILFCLSRYHCLDSASCGFSTQGKYSTNKAPPRWNPPWRGEGAYLTKRFSPQRIKKKSWSERCGYVR